MLGWHHQLNWTWVWANSGSWWWTGKPGVLQSMGSQRVRHDWVTELNWTGTGRFLVKVVWVNTCEGTPSFWCNPSYLPISNLCAASPLPSWTKLFNNANTSLAWAAIASTAPTEIYIYITWAEVDSTQNYLTSSFTRMYWAPPDMPHRYWCKSVVVAGVGDKSRA